MAERLMQRTLRFRRHLALCGLVLLLGELRLLPIGNQAEEPHQIHDDDGHQLSGYAFTRVKLAAAALNVNVNEQQPSMAAPSPEQLSHIYQHDTDEMSFKSILGRLLAKINTYLPVVRLDYQLTSGNKTFTQHKLDMEVESYYNGQFPSNMSLDELQLISVKAAIRMAPIPLHTSWGYQTDELLRQSSQPVVDDQLCSQQLAHLSWRLDRALEMGAKLQQQQQQQSLVPGELGGDQSVVVPPPSPASPVDNFESQLVYRTLDLDLMKLLDSYGRVPSDLLRGNVKWYGSYSTCLDTRLKPFKSAAARSRMSAGKPTSYSYLQEQLDNRESMKFRYCMAAVKSVGWRSQEGPPPATNTSRGSHYDGVMSVDDSLGNYFIRLGVCLPEACDSSALSRPSNLRHIERLSKFNLARPFNSDHYRLTDLYCVPDERSPLREIPLMGKLLLLAVLGWLGLIGLATVIHLNVDKFYTKIVDKIRAKSAGKSNNNATSGANSSINNNNDDVNDNEDDSNQFNESDFLHLKLNWIKLNIYLRDKSRSLVVGIDPVDCLSLYSNWLKYTRRVKLSILAENRTSQLLEKRRLRNETLLKTAKHANGHLQQQQSQLEIINGSASGQEQLVGDEKEEIRREELELEGLLKQRRVDTSSLNALKVIALVWIICGHCIFYMGSVISNGALLKNYLRDLMGFALANGAVYITELFFVITGCLTAYLAFKYNTKVVRIPAAGEPDDHLQDRRPKEAKTAGLMKLSGSSAGQEEEADATTARGEPTEECQCLLEARVFSPAFWTGIVANRYLRIMPTYLFVYSFVKLVSLYVGGEGPTWDYAVSPNSMRRHCAQESFWPVLTLTTNFVEIYKQCIVGGWYLSVDMQFMLMSVPLLILLANSQLLLRSSKWSSSPASSSKWPLSLKNYNKNKMTVFGGAAAANNNNHELTQVVQETTNTEASGQQTTTRTTTGEKRLVAYAEPRRISAAYAVIFSLACLSAIISMYFAVISSDVDFSFLVRFSPHTVAMLSRSIGMYTNPVFRFRAMAIGLILGHLLYLYEFNLIRLPAFLQRHGTKVTALIFLTGFTVMFLPVLYPKGKIILSHDVTAILTVACASSIDIFLSLLIFFICIGKAPKFVLFALNSPFWSLFSSLSLSAFLVHTEVIVLLTSQLDPPPSVSYGILLFVFSATLLVTYSLALGLFLSFEMPVGRLIDAAMRKYLENSRTTGQNKEARAGATGDEFEVVGGNLKMRRDDKQQ